MTGGVDPLGGVRMKGKIADPEAVDVNYFTSPGRRRRGCSGRRVVQLRIIRVEGRILLKSAPNTTTATGSRLPKITGKIATRKCFVSFATMGPSAGPDGDPWVG